MTSCLPGKRLAFSRRPLFSTTIIIRLASQLPRRGSHFREIREFRMASCSRTNLTSHRDSELPMTFSEMGRLRFVGDMASSITHPEQSPWPTHTSRRPSLHLCPLFLLASTIHMGPHTQIRSHSL